MAYGTKYITEFRDINENLWKVVFKKNDYSGSASNVESGSEPIAFSAPRTGKFDAVKGAGATIQLFSETDRQYIDLYTASHKEWKVETYKNGSLVMPGYVEPETYTEDFSRDSNYTVSVLVNNGINILDREKYVNKWGANYTGVATMFQVVLNAVAKMEIDFDNIIYATDLRINRLFVPVSETILHQMVVNQGNYIDEDGEVMSCREVLDSVLLPLSLSLFISGNDLWIADVEYLKNGEIYVKEAPYSTCVFTQKKIDITKDITFLYQASSTFQLLSGFNNYIIKKNRYVTNPIELVDFDSEDSVLYKEVGDGAKWGGTSQFPDLWFVIYLTSFSNYKNKACICGGIKSVTTVDDVEIQPDEDGVDYTNYIFITPPWDSEFDYLSAGTSISYPAPLPSSYGDISQVAFYFNGDTPFLFPSTTSYILLSFTCYLLSRGKPQTSYNDSLGSWVLSYDNLDLTEYTYIRHTIKIVFKDYSGNIKYSVVNNGAVTSADLVFSLEAGDHSTYYIIDSVNEAGSADDVLFKQLPISLQIPADFDGVYQMSLIFYDEFYRLVDGEEVGDYQGAFPYLGIRDIETDIIDSEGDSVDLEDAEMQFYLSEQYKSDSQTDELTTYTAEEKFIADMSGITLGSDYIVSAQANGISMPDLEYLKGEKMQRQYKDTQVELTITFEEDDIPIYTLLTMRNDAHWADKQWVIVSMTHDVRLCQIQLVLEEIK
jgi:hypothetical protein